MSVQWIACPECAFRLPYAILGKQGSFRTGREFASLCHHYAELPAASAGNGSFLPKRIARVCNIRILNLRPFIPALTRGDFPPQEYPREVRRLGGRRPPRLAP